MDTEQTDKPTIPGSQGQAPSTPYYTLVLLVLKLQRNLRNKFHK